MNRKAILVSCLCVFLIGIILGAKIGYQKIYNKGYDNGYAWGKYDGTMAEVASWKKIFESKGKGIRCLVAADFEENGDVKWKAFPINNHQSVSDFSLIDFTANIVQDACQKIQDERKRLVSAFSNSGLHTME